MSQYVRPRLIDGVMWYVRVVKRMPKGGASCYGFCDFTKKIIYLSEKQSDFEMFCTYTHEYLHVRYPKKTEKQICQMEVAFLELWFGF